jgi:hypothetical protein
MLHRTYFKKQLWFENVSSLAKVPKICDQLREAYIEEYIFFLLKIGHVGYKKNPSFALIPQM